MRLRLSLLILFALGVTAAAFSQKKADPIVPGDATLFLGARPNRILILDEAAEKVTGHIDTKTGYPTGLHLSKDHKRLYVRSSTLEDIEIVDVESRKVIDNFRLSEGNKRVRIRGSEADPLHRFMILVTRAATKHEDRWEIGPNTILQYDLKEHKVMRTVPWPKNEEREFANFLFSPDGKLLYMFGEDIVIYDTTDFKEVDKWELSRPLEDGFGRINFGSLTDDYEEPGFFTGMFNVNDAVQNRRIMGIARVDMARKSVDFYAIGPSTGIGFALAPGRKLGYGLHSEIGKHEFWTFDLEKRRLQNRTEFPGRPRMSIKTSSNGKVLYIYQAGNTIDLYDAATYKYLRTITLDADMTTDLAILPKGSRILQ